MPDNKQAWVECIDGVWRKRVPPKPPRRAPRDRPTKPPVGNDQQLLYRTLTVFGMSFKEFAPLVDRVYTSLRFFLSDHAKYPSLDPSYRRRLHALLAMREAETAARAVQEKTMEYADMRCVEGIKLKGWQYLDHASSCWRCQGKILVEMGK